MALAILLTFSANPLTAADGVALHPDHPSSYTVVKGDTLWDISGRFLQNPWDWPEVWEINPEIENPHLIYPGDVIELSFIDGKPHLGLSKHRKARNGDGRISPRIRVERLDSPIPVIPVEAMLPFLKATTVLSDNVMDDAPYLLNVAGDRLVGSTGAILYVRSIDNQDSLKFEIVRDDGVYRDPDSNELLGYKAVHVGTADLLTPGDPARMIMTNSAKEARIGDRFLAVTLDEVLNNFTLKLAPENIKGRIIDVLNGVNQIGQYNVVALSAGDREGLQPGMLLGIYHDQGKVYDQVIDNGRTRVQLPLELAGVLVVFRTFEKSSFALVLYAQHALHVGDQVERIARRMR
ncbi:MAG: LysM peptidoglycan-binding domain-containing protein [gamma proteobacterium symbiont of Bathyaustriella thionipta]|nr:LysM peptidoglycan-binding domain-containing protein [gamma proteobacterium symbiont of Bathyaustriella thionipta]